MKCEVAVQTMVWLKCAPAKPNDPDQEIRKAVTCKGTPRDWMVG